MAERLPNRGETPYYDVLVPWLRKNRNADGTLAVLAPHSDPSTFVALNGSTIAANRRYSIAGSGATKQHAFCVEIAGASVGDATTDRIAAYFGAQTGGNAGNPIWGANIVIQANAVDTDAQAIGLELNVNNNKADVPSDLSGTTLKYAYSADSGGSKISGIAFNIGASGGAIAAWRRGVYINQGAIASGGYAFEYKGSGAANTNLNLTELGQLLFGHLIATGAGNGEPVLANAKSLRGVNAAGNNTFGLIQVDSSDRLQVAPGTNNVIFGFGGGIVLVGTTLTTGASGSDVVLRNARSIRGVNAASSNTLELLQLNGADQLRLGAGVGDIIFGKALVALGGGAAPTFGTIGGSGPATAAQNSWMRWLDSAGNAMWIPVWK